MADATHLTFAGEVPWSARLREVLLWSLLGVVLIGLFTVIAFPFDALHARVAAELGRQTGTTVQIDVRRALRPLGIEWVGVRMTQGERPLLSLGRLTGVLSLADALQGKPVVTVSVWMDAKGAAPPISAKIAFADWGFQRVMLVDGGVERLDLHQVAGAPVRSGRAKATFRFESSAADTAGMLDGHLHLEVSDLAVEQMVQQGFRIPEWGFSALRATVQCAQQVCRIGEFAGDGPDGSLTASGQIMVGRSPDDSRWDVGATLTCSQAFSQRASAVGGFPIPAGIPLRVKLVGPLLRPQITM